MRSHCSLLNIRRIIFVCSVLFLLSSCASMGKSECLAGDWASIGKTDASKGELATQRLTAHSEACGKHGVQPDQTIYMVGYAEGLETYCTKEKGFTTGSRYKQYQYKRAGYAGVCPDELELNYLQGYVKGLQSNLQNLESELSIQKKELKVREPILLVQQLVGSAKSDKQQAKVDRLSEKVSSLELTIKDTKFEIERWMVARPELEKTVIN